MNIGIIGSGVYGKAIANLLINNGNMVTMWTEVDLTKDKLQVPDGVKLTNSFKEVTEKMDILYLLTSSKFIENILENIRDLVESNTIVVLGSKGILKNGIIITDAAKKYLPKRKLAVISGPTFAIDILKLEPLGFTLATKNKIDFNIVSKAMKSVYLEYSSDLTGVEICGSLKNVYAIGSGILEGMDYGKSIKSLYIARVLKEMREILIANKCKKDTILDLAGVGDLVLTCTSLNSRNFTFGTILSLGKIESTNEYLKNNTVEGYENLNIYIDLLNKNNVEAPIMNAIYDIVKYNKDAKILIDVLIKKV